MAQKLFGTVNAARVIEMLHTQLLTKVQNGGVLEGQHRRVLPLGGNLTQEIVPPEDPDDRSFWIWDLDELEEDEPCP